MAGIALWETRNWQSHKRGNPLWHIHVRGDHLRSIMEKKMG